MHVRNLGALGEEMGIGSEEKLGKRNIELYERGYGKDAAGIAKDAIAYGEFSMYPQTVLILDQPKRIASTSSSSILREECKITNRSCAHLLRFLSLRVELDLADYPKLVAVNNPDKIIFVGEALVGNEAVDQLTKFDRALKDFSSAGIGATQRKRGIDGIILTKFDTIVCVLPLVSRNCVLTPETG